MNKSTYDLRIRWASGLILESWLGVVPQSWAWLDLEYNNHCDHKESQILYAIGVNKITFSSPRQLNATPQH